MGNKIKEDNIIFGWLILMTILCSIGLIFSEGWNKIVYGFGLFAIGNMWGMRNSS